MKYIDIHTHTVIPKTQENRISFYNRIVGQETLGDLSHIEMFSVGIHDNFIRSNNKPCWLKNFTSHLSSIV